MKKLKFFRKEGGQAAALFAVTITVMLLGAALVTDYGRPALEGRKLQNAADSAALAVAHLLPTADRTSAQAIAYEFASKNVSLQDPSQVTVELSEPSSDGKYRKAKVSVQSSVEFTFAKLMGRQEMDLERHASAQLLPVNGVKGTVPIAIKKPVFESNVASGTYYMQLKYGGGGGTMGDYGAVDPDGSNGGGANDYRNRLKNGYNSVLSQGDVIRVESGNMSGPTADGIYERYHRCTHSPRCTVDHYDPDCPRVMLVPIVTELGNKQLKVEGFAPFFLGTDTVGSGNDSEIFATYIPGYTVSEGEVTSTARDYGIYVRKLTD